MSSLFRVVAFDGVITVDLCCRMHGEDGKKWLFHNTHDCHFEYAVVIPVYNVVVVIQSSS